MALRDMFNGIAVKRVLSPTVAVTDDTAFVGQIIDTKGYDALTYLIQTGSLADANATFTVLLEEGDDSALADAAAVADKDLLGTEVLAAFNFGDDNECRKLGYVGSKRYTRLTITPAANTGDVYISAMAMMCPLIQPAPNPPTA